MKIFENFLKKFHNQKGITGADVAIALIIIAATIGVVASIYINITNTSKENIRYSAATRIATQIAENIEAMSYEEVKSITKLEIAANTTEEERKIFNVTVPKGYSVKLTVLDITSSVDVVKKFNIEVSYRVRNNYNDTISLQVIKQRELLEQTNSPELDMIPDYDTSSKYYYPIKLTDSGYVITTTSDKDWYNYDIGYYANVYVSNTVKNIGDIVVPGTNQRYVWVPRFGKIEDTQLTKNNIAFLYGTSKHIIVFKNISNSFYSYTIDYSNGVYSDAAAYVEDTFKDNDGLEGMWYLINSTENDSSVQTAYNALNTIFPIKN